MSSPLPDQPPLELFRLELEERVVDLNQALLALEVGAADGAALDLLMRSLHSVKGAAGIVGLGPLVALLHQLEGSFAPVKAGQAGLGDGLIALGFRAVDLLETFSRLQPAAMAEAMVHRQPELDELGQALATLAPAARADAGTAGTGRAGTTTAVSSAAGSSGGLDRVVRVEADSLNRIMGLSGELLVEARWLQPFADSLAQLRRRQQDLQAAIEALRLELGANGTGGGTLLERVRQRERECRDILAERLAELDLYSLRTTNLSERLYREVINSNMRPLADALPALPRLVRDLGKTLGKQVRLEVVGRKTLVDRDILQRLEAPLIHLLRNAVDHGIEPPAERLARGKPERGTIRLEALHRGGMLAVSLSDDGGGVDGAVVRARLVSDGRCTVEEAEALAPADLLAALEQPGFSTAATVTEVSGRGVGLDAVRAMVQEVGGSLRFSSRPGEGSTVQLQLPLTLSVVRTLLVEIGGEPYAFPLARLDQIVALEAEGIQRNEGREFAMIDGTAIGLIAARQLLGLPPVTVASPVLPVVVISDAERVVGVVVDRHLGEQDLVVRPLDPRLGKVACISAAALMGDGQPILIVDTVELMHSIDGVLKAGQPLQPSQPAVCGGAQQVLVVDDSRVALDLQTRLLRSAGYRVAQASGGSEALALLRAGGIDLLVTDVEMPEIDGIALIEALRQDQRLAELPVVICSSRGSEDDRLRGMEAGADYYLGKHDFQGEALVDAAHQLIGPAVPRANGR
ncbi:MAG: response regulator [Cyanobacteriota bacterium]|nr:response regulator [Cyanobacteriota bacterium]